MKSILKVFLGAGFIGVSLLAAGCGSGASTGSNTAIEWSGGPANFT